MPSSRRRRGRRLAANLDASVDLQRLGEAGQVERRAAQRDVRDFAAPVLGAVEVERVTDLAGNFANAVLEDLADVVDRDFAAAGAGSAVGLTASIVSRVAHRTSRASCSSG